MSVAEPPRFTFDDFLSEMIEIHEDTAQCRTVLGPARHRRLEVLERFGVLLQIARPRIIAALSEATREIEKSKK
jgi:hypothetical protein